MRAKAKNLKKLDIAFRILEGMNKRLTMEPCRHPIKLLAKNIRIFLKEGHLASNPDAATRVEKVVYCANPTCEHVFSVTYHGAKLNVA